MPGSYAQPQNYFKKKRITSEKLFLDATTPMGLRVHSRPASAIGTVLIRSKTTSIDIGPTTVITTTAATSSWLSPTPRDFVSFKVCDKLRVQALFKGGDTIRNLLMAPKDKDNITQKSWVIHRFRCAQAYCKEEYIGESWKTFWDRLKEHIKSPPLYTTLATLQDIASVLGSSRRLCLSGSIIHPSMGT